VKTCVSASISASREAISIASNLQKHLAFSVFNFSECSRCAVISHYNSHSQVTKIKCLFTWLPTICASCLLKFYWNILAICLWTVEF
jgi:hypothetical protein